MPLSAGTRLGHYAVTTLLGEGGIALKVVAICLVLASVTHAQNVPLPWTELGPATLLRTESFDVGSRSTGRTYRIWVHTPENYDSAGSYPVVYLLDAVWDMDTTVGIVRRLKFEDFVPDLVIVGVGYQDHETQVRHRAQDFTPTRAPWFVERLRERLPEWAPDGTGEADRFYAFLRDELVPQIENRFGVSSNDRTLIGHSFGGLFALHAMFRSDRVFQKYVALSPSLFWGDGVVFAQEAAFARSTSELLGRLFVSVGGSEPESNPVLEPETSVKMVSNVRQLERLLERRSYDGLDWTVQVFPDEQHDSVVAGAISRGLRHAFAGHSDSSR